MIIHRALIREVLQTSGAVTLVMLSIFLVVRVVGFLRQAADGDIPIDSVMILLLLKMVTYLDIILPLMLFVSILMVLGRWNRDNEMTVIAASGISLANFLRPMTVICIIGVVIVGGFSLYISPLAVTVAENIKQEFDNRSEVTGIVPGVFTETRGGRGVYFVESFDKDDGDYRNVFAYGQSFDREGVVFANTAFQEVDQRTNDPFLILKDGVRYEGNPGDPSYVVVEFETYAIRLKQRPAKKAEIPVSGMATPTLLRGEHHRMKSEFHWRLAKPVTILVLILFALAFSHVDVRSSRLPSFLLAFLIYFTYTNLLGVTVALMNRGKLNPHISLWVVHVVFFLLAAYLFWRRASSKSLVSIPRLRHAT